MKDGGPAFPRSGMTFPNGDSDYPEPGMTLRDYFAGQALAAGMGFGSAYESDGWEQGTANQCYALADAMLKAREES